MGKDRPWMKLDDGLQSSPVFNKGQITLPAAMR